MRLEVLAGFKPRARTGRDALGDIDTLDIYMFQATRPHGARRKPLHTTRHVKQFQATRPHGARLCGFG